MRDLEKVRTVGRVAIKQVRPLIMAGFDRRLTISYKNEMDLVTEIDLASERGIVSVIEESFPEDGILGEEGGEVRSGSECRWVIDPLDGTTNFAHHFPFFCISIGFEENGVLRYGIIHDPIREQTFEAEKGKGATLNGEPILVSKTPRLSDALLCTGFAAARRDDPQRNNMPFFDRFWKKCHGIRRTGSAALDLCYVATGALDGFWELGLSPWDTAAGSLIVRESGGIVTDRDGSPHSLKSACIVASNGLIHGEMVSTLAL
ncbi:MAG: inositol monophosphatase family protein [Nitrospiraceae bacterium]|jgi:myo-inositol-1(or 4)-monophosphatase|nr:inositol monophosphatase family protein [Nitrospiraceae bacterium]